MELDPLPILRKHTLLKTNRKGCLGDLLQLENAS